MIIYKHGTKTTHLQRGESVEKVTGIITQSIYKLFQSFCLYHMLFSSAV